MSSEGRAGGGVATEPGGGRMMTPREVADWLGCSDDSVHRFCRGLGLPYRLLGRRKRFVRAEVQSWLDARKVVATEPPPADAPAPAASSPRPDPGPPADWRHEIRRIGRDRR